MRETELALAIPHTGGVTGPLSRPPSGNEFRLLRAAAFAVRVLLLLRERGAQSVDLRRRTVLELARSSRTRAVPPASASCIFAASLAQFLGRRCHHRLRLRHRHCGCTCRRGHHRHRRSGGATRPGIEPGRRLTVTGRVQPTTASLPQPPMMTSKTTPRSAPRARNSPRQRGKWTRRRTCSRSCTDGHRAAGRRHCAADRLQRRPLAPRRLARRRRRRARRRRAGRRQARRQRSRQAVARGMSHKTSAFRRTVFRV